MEWLRPHGLLGFEYWCGFWKKAVLVAVCCMMFWYMLGKVVVSACGGRFLKIGHKRKRSQKVILWKLSSKPSWTIFCYTGSSLMPILRIRISISNNFLLRGICPWQKICTWDNFFFFWDGILFSVVYYSVVLPVMKSVAIRFMLKQSKAWDQECAALLPLILVITFWAL